MAALAFADIFGHRCGWCAGGEENVVDVDHVVGCGGQGHRGERGAGSGVLRDDEQVDAVAVGALRGEQADPINRRAVLVLWGRRWWTGVSTRPV